MLVVLLLHPAPSAPGRTVVLEPGELDAGPDILSCIETRIDTDTQRGIAPWRPGTGVSKWGVWVVCGGPRRGAASLDTTLHVEQRARRGTGGAAVPYGPRARVCRLYGVSVCRFLPNGFYKSIRSANGMCGTGPNGYPSRGRMVDISGTGLGPGT